MTDDVDTDLDKQSINYATVFGMNTDLNLSGSGFSWVITLFYFGQFASEYVSAYFISRFNVVRVVGITMYDIHHLTYPCVAGRSPLTMFLIM